LKYRKRLRIAGDYGTHLYGSRDFALTLPALALNNEPIGLKFPL
jgi:hypothetical protein